MSATVMPTTSTAVTCRGTPMATDERGDVTATQRNAAAVSAEARENVVADADGVGHDGQRRIDRAARREKAAIHDIQVVYVVRFAMRIERRHLWIVAKSHGSILMGNARQRDAVPNEQVPRHQMRVHIQVLEKMLQLLDQTFVARVIVRRVGEDDVAVAVERDAVVRIGEIL